MIPERQLLEWLGTAKADVFADWASHRVVAAAGCDLPAPRCDLLGDTGGPLDAAHLVVLHKGRLDELSASFWRSHVARTSIAYANEVYLVLAVAPVDIGNVHELSLYSSTPADAPTPTEIPAPNVRSQSLYLGRGVVQSQTAAGHIIYLLGEDRSLTPHIVRDGFWERWVTRTVEEMLGPGDVFIDIGANCGYFSLHAAGLVGPTGAVVSIEPQARLASLVERSMDVNGFASRTRVVRCGVGATKAEMSLTTTAGFTGSASLVDDHFRDPTRETVRVDTLESIMEASRAELGRPLAARLIKIDVEGYEYEAWKGMLPYLRTLDRHAIIMEFSPERYRQQGVEPQIFAREINDAGYRISVIEHEGERRIANHDDPRLEGGGHIDLLLESHTGRTSNSRGGGADPGSS